MQDTVCTHTHTHASASELTPKHSDFNNGGSLFELVSILKFCIFTLGSDGGGDHFHSLVSRFITFYQQKNSRGKHSESRRPNLQLFIHFLWYVIFFPSSFTLTCCNGKCLTVTSKSHTVTNASLSSPTFRWVRLFSRLARCKRTRRAAVLPPPSVSSLLISCRLMTS